MPAESSSKPASSTGAQADDRHYTADEVRALVRRAVNETLLGYGPDSRGSEAIDAYVEMVMAGWA